MEITLAQLTAIMPYAKERASVFLAPLNAAMQEFQINTPLRIAAFLAEVSVESGQLRYVKEIASGEAYEGRKDLGNTHAGWGVLYKGRGLLQVTGFYQYCIMEAALKIPCTAHPDLLEEPINACRSAAYFFASHGLNELADKGDFLTASIRINGKNKDGYPNGWKDRLAAYNAAKGVLKC